MNQGTCNTCERGIWTSRLKSFCVKPLIQMPFFHMCCIFLRLRKRFSKNKKYRALEKWIETKEKGTHITQHMCRNTYYATHVYTHITQHMLQKEACEWDFSYINDLCCMQKKGGTVRIGEERLRTHVHIGEERLWTHVHIGEERLRTYPLQCARYHPMLHATKGG